MVFTKNSTNKIVKQSDVIASHCALVPQAGDLRRRTDAQTIAKLVLLFISE